MGGPVASPEADIQLLEYCMFSSVSSTKTFRVAILEQG